MRANSDESLRRLEREYASTRDGRVRLRLIQERLRRGLLDPARVRLAALFGDQQAIEVGLPRLKVTWADDDYAQAELEGWGFFDSDTYGLEIGIVQERDIDEPPIYRTDDAAREGVAERARGGEIYAMKALFELKSNNTAAYQETIFGDELHKILKKGYGRGGYSYGDYVADVLGWERVRPEAETKTEAKRASARKAARKAAAAIEARVERNLIDSFLGLAPMRSNPDEDLRQLERDAQQGGLVELERWLAARRRKEPKLFERLAYGDELEVTKRLILARIDEGRPNAEQERWWLYWIGFEPLSRPTWDPSGSPTTWRPWPETASDHPVLAGLLAAELIAQQVNVESNGYELATNNTKLVDRVQKLAMDSLVKNFQAGLLEPKPSTSVEKSILSGRRALQKVIEGGQEAIDEDLDTVEYGRVTYGDELSQFPNVAGAVLALADFATAGRPADLGVIAETAYEMRGMEYFSDDEFRELISEAARPVIRRVLESGPILGGPK